MQMAWVGHPFALNARIHLSDMVQETCISNQRASSVRTSIQPGGSQMSDSKKCAHPACSCMTQKGEDFCSTYCESTKGTTEIMCKCGHSGCRGDVTT
jgi:hypothetical protein